MTIVLCDNCHQREATIHITSCFASDGWKRPLYCQFVSRSNVDPETSVWKTVLQRRDFCAECAKQLSVISAPSADFECIPIISALPPIVDSIVAQDPRYTARVYELVLQAVGFAVQAKLSQMVQGTHISAKKLLEALRSVALALFRKDAKRRLNECGIKGSEDVGEITFNAVKAGLLGVSPEDKKEDFRGGMDFDSAFPDH